MKTRKRQHRDRLLRLCPKARQGRQTPAATGTRRDPP